jgi:membrane-bound lytic murein transglycosylase D
MTRPENTFPKPDPIEVSLHGTPEGTPLEFSTSFRIGRGDGCEVRILNEYVSRVHAEVAPEKDGWRIRDLNSSNGLYRQGEKVDNFLIGSVESIRFGVEGPELSFRIKRPPVPEKPASSTIGNNLFKSDPSIGDDSMVARYAERYFRTPVEGEAVGEHTMYVRRAFVQVQTQQTKAHTRQRLILFAVIGFLLVAGAITGGYTYRLHRDALRQREIAHNLFYAMKSLDVEIGEAERIAMSADRKQGLEAVNKFEARRQEMQSNYDRFLATLHIYDPKATEQHRLILRVARVFGECELDMPPDFENEVLRYIKYWQSTGRFTKDIRLAKEKGYTRTIPDALLARGLPVQFFYLALQESDFDHYRSGPLTRKGFAKGMWQFIPETAVKYGLHLGPLVDLGRLDPADERGNVDKSTDAASRYLQMLYSTDAQASGLLVMACYNWGEGQVLPLVRSMPMNPRERNFWRLLAEHRNQIPQETYDYVFYITSAAVIGENPRLFGFDFDNPLEESH